MQELTKEAQLLIIVVFMQEDVEARSCRQKVRRRGRITVVPPEGNQIRTRLRKSELNSPGKECGIPSRRTQGRKEKD